MSTGDASPGPAAVAALWDPQQEAPDPRHKLVVVRSFATPQERDAGRRKMDISWPHVRPDSVLVAAMGNHWPEGAWHRVVDMILETNRRGVYAALSEVQDRCFDPYDSLGTMRNEAILEAQYEGFEWLLYVDCDIRPEPDTILRLLAWQMPIVAPLVVEPGTGKPLHGPAHAANGGLKPAKWCVLSMLLFRTTVFNCTGPRFWGDAIGADEGYHFKTLWLYGHRPWIDTNTQLVVGGKPTYPLAYNRRIRTEPDRQASEAKARQWLSAQYPPQGVEDVIQYVRDTARWDGRAQFWRQKAERLLQPPDRRPPTPDSPGVIDGEYLPFFLDGSVEAGRAPSQIPPNHVLVQAMAE